MNIDRPILGIDIGGTNFRMGIVSSDHQVSNLIIHPSSILENNAPQNLEDTIAEYLHQYDPENQVFAIGIGFPSIVSKDEKRVYSTPNLKGLDNLNIVDPLERKFNRRVYISRDVNYLLKYDMVTYRLDRNKIILGFYVGTGFGNSIHINGDILRGKNGVAGELGHIPVYNHSEPCPCGNEGCIETIASGKRLAHIVAKHFPQTPIQDAFIKHADSEILKHFIYTLSLPMATEINLFDPDHVIVSGGVVAMDGFPKELLTEYIVKHVRKPYPANSLDLIFPQHDKFSGVLGAAYYIFDNLNKNNQ